MILSINSAVCILQPANNYCCFADVSTLSDNVNHAASMSVRSEALYTADTVMSNVQAVSHFCDILITALKPIQSTINSDRVTWKAQALK